MQQNIESSKALAPCAGRRPRPRLRTVAVAVLTAALAACDDTATDVSTSSSSGTGGQLASSSTSATSTAGTGGAGGEGGRITVNTLTARVPHSAVEGVHVAVADSSGAIVSEANSDAFGVAHLPFVEGGTLLAFDEVHYVQDNKVYDNRYIYSYWDLLAGATVILPYFDILDEPPVPPENVPMGNVAVTVSSLPPGATYVRIRASCDNEKTLAIAGLVQPIVLAGFKGCAGSDKYTVVVRATDSVGKYLAVGAALDQPYTPGQPASFSIATSAADLGALHADLTGIPAGAKQAYIQVNGQRTSSEAGAGFQVTQAMPMGSQFSLSDAAPNKIFDTWFALGTIAVDDDFQFFRQVQVSQLSPPSNLVMDFAEIAALDPLPPTDVSDVARPALSWSIGSGKLGDCVLNSVGWGTEFVRTAWVNFSAASSGDNLRLPILPAQYATWLPQPGDMFSRRSTSHVQDDDVIDYPDWVSKITTGNNEAVSYRQL